MVHKSTRDVVVIGAGSAGLAAADVLKRACVDVLVVEAKGRVGGRAHTIKGPSGAALDLGCGWLHSADQNVWARHVEPMGFTLDRSKAAWTKPALTVNFPAEEQAAYRAVFEAFEARLETAAKDPHDQVAADLLGPQEARWRPLLDSFSGAYNGAALNHISVKDYAAYQPTSQNWRVKEGYGALMTTFAGSLNVEFNLPVERIDHSRSTIGVAGPWGAIETQLVIIAVPTTVMAEGQLAFNPPLPDKQDASSQLPLGNVEKAFLTLRRPTAWPSETMVRGSTSTAAAGSYTLRPMGLPLVEGFFGGEMAAALELEGDGAFCAYAIEQLTSVLGANFRREVEPIAESGWRSDPFIRGAYSHARVGHAGARAILAEPVKERLFFAGEATSPHAFSTAHGAFETGVIAANDALTALRR